MVKTESITIQVPVEMRKYLESFHRSRNYEEMHFCYIPIF